VKIVLICGILDDARKTPIWTNLSEAFEGEYGPKPSVERLWYHFYMRSVMREFRDDIVARHDTGEPILLCGHSAGGAIAFAVANGLRRSTVVGVVTIFSPLSMPIDFLRMLDVPVPDVPIVSFGARHDIIVPYPFTRHPTSVAHKILPTDHQEGLIADPRISRIIARYAHRHIPKPGSR